jgi:hypothetical protein
VTGIRLLTATSRIADRVWELHSAELQDMSEEDLAGFAADQLAPLDPTISDVQGVVQRLQTHQRDNARPPDAKPMTDDPLDRYFQ